MQYTFKGAFYALPFREPTMIKGEGASLKLADLLKKKRVNNILFVTDPTLMKIGLAEPILKALEEGGVRYSLFYDIEQNPTNENVEDGYAVYAANGCQAGRPGRRRSDGLRQRHRCQSGSPENVCQNADGPVPGT